MVSISIHHPLISRIVSVAKAKGIKFYIISISGYRYYKFITTTAQKHKLYEYMKNQ